MPEAEMVRAWERRRGSGIWAERRSEKPMMELRGVRNSWPRLAMNSDLARLADSARDLAAAREALKRRRLRLRKKKAATTARKTRATLTTRARLKSRA